MGQWRQTSISFLVICLLWDFSNEEMVILLVSWPSSPFFFLKINVNFWHETLFTDFFPSFILGLSLISNDCSPPLPPRPWRSVRTQGWPSPSGCPTSTTSSWRRSWTSRGSSTSPSATRWAAQLLSLLLFRTSFLDFSLMSVCPPLLFIQPLWTEDSRDQSPCLDGVNRTQKGISVW